MNKQLLLAATALMSLGMALSGSAYHIEEETTPSGLTTYEWRLGGGNLIVCESNNATSSVTLFPTGASLGEIVMNTANGTYYLVDDTAGGGVLPSPSQFEQGELVYDTVTSLPVVGDPFGPIPVLPPTTTPANSGEGGLCFMSPGYDAAEADGNNDLRSNGLLPDGTDASDGTTATGVPDSDVYVTVTMCGYEAGNCEDTPFLAQGGSFSCDVQENEEFVYNEMFLYWDNGGHVEGFINTTAAPPTTGTYNLTDSGSEPTSDRCHAVYPVWTL